MPILHFGSKRTPSPAPPQSREERARVAFDMAYRELVGPARDFTRRHVDQRWADDVIQDAFLGLWESCFHEQEPPMGNVDDLLFRILRRRIVDLRRRESAAEARDDEHVFDITPRLTDHTDTACVADASILDGRIAYLIATLPPQMRRAHELRATGHAHLEIAAALDISEATARWNVFEARRRLRKQLMKDGYDVPVTPARSTGVQEP